MDYGINGIIGGRIRRRREELGLTLGDIAADVGVAVSTIQRYESGTFKKVKMPVIESIASALRVNPGWLIGEAAESSVNDGGFNPSEKNMVNKYRVLDPHGKKSVDITLDHEFERCTASASE